MINTLASCLDSATDGLIAAVTPLLLCYAVHRIRLICGCRRGELECIAAAWSALRRRRASRTHTSRRVVIGRCDQAQSGR